MTRVLTTKTVVFVWCWTPPQLVQCIVPRAVSKTPPPIGSVIAVTGVWQPYGGKRQGFASQEMVAEQVQILTSPTNPLAAQQRWSSLDRPIALVARSKAIAAAEQYLRDHDFARIETPVIVGNQATVGATAPFVVQTDREKAYLTVNNILRQHEYQQCGLPQIYEISRLFWAQHYSDRFSLNEIYLLEYSMAGTERKAVMMLTEELLEVIRHAVLKVVSEYGGKRSVLTKSLRNLPVLTFAEVVERAIQAGITLRHAGHVLPSVVDSIVAGQLGSAGFWVIDAPADASPFYTRRIASDSGIIGCSMELRLTSVPNAGAGSEWVTEAEMGEEITASWSETPAGSHYLDILRRGLPPCTGFTLGLDRLLMHLLELQNIRQIVPQVRDRRSFRNAPPVIRQERTLIEPDRFTALPARPITMASSKQIARVSEWLESRDFLPCISSLLTDPWSLVLAGVPPVETNYFGRAVPLVVDRAVVHHELLSEGLDRIFEIGPVAGTPWWRPGWKLDVSWIDPEISELQEMAITLIRMLADREGIDQAFTTAVHNLTPANLTTIVAGQPGYIRNSARGPIVAGFTWSWQGDQILRGGLWISRESELETALGKFAEDDLCSTLRAFLNMAPPPAGGISINLSSFPGIEWGPAFNLESSNE